MTQVEQKCEGYVPSRKRQCAKQALYRHPKYGWPCCDQHMMPWAEHAPVRLSVAREKEEK